MSRRGWPFVGRETELRSIETARTDSGAAAVVIAGAAGIGKTMLATEAVTRAAATGCDTSWAVATRAAASIPFGALSGLLPGGPEVSGALHVLREMTDHIGGRARQRPVVLGIDDAHLLDDASAALIHTLVTRSIAFVIATVRAGEPAPDAIRALYTSERVHQLPISALPPTVIDGLIDAGLDGPVDGITRLEIRRLADGNPLLLRELLREATAAGTLREKDGVWRWSGPLRGSPFLYDLVASRVALVDPAAREVLELVACGEPVPVALLDGLADPGAVEAAERSGVLVIEPVSGGLAARLAHPLYGEVLRATLPLRRAGRARARLAEALAATPMRGRDDALRAAVWQLESGRIEHPSVLVPAARQALARYDLDLAERLARAAADHVPSGVDGLLAEILSARGRYNEAAELLGDPANSADAYAATRAAILYWGLGKTGEALEETASGMDAVRSWILLFDGCCREAVATGRRVLDGADATGEAVVQAAAGVMAASALLGRFDQAMAARSRGLTVLAGADGGPSWAAEQLGYATCVALIAAGRLREAWTAADRGYQEAVAAKAALAAGCWLAFRGVTEKTQGRVATATASLREAVVLLDDSDPFRIRPACLGKLAGAAALSGDAAAASAWLARAEEEASEANRLFAPWVELDRAWVLASAGELSAALSAATAAIELARETEQPMFEVMALYDAARLGGARAVAPRLVALAGELDGALAPALAAAATALRDQDGSALERAAVALDDLGLFLLGAEAAAAAARAYRQAGRRGRAVTAQQRATFLASACEGARTPLLARMDADELLTPREREAVLLAAAGHHSREIAARLQLSVRTVDNYLGRAYAKLGVKGRADLPDLLGPGG